MTPEDPVEQALRQGRPAMIQFGANACAACRAMRPVVEALQREHGTRFKVMHVDLIAQKHRGYLQCLRIQLILTQGCCSMLRVRRPTATWAR